MIFSLCSNGHRNFYSCKFRWLGSSRQFFFLCSLSHSLFNFIPYPPHLLYRSSLRIVQVPVNQFLLHRRQHRLGTCFFDGAAHRDNEARLANHVGCQRFRGSLGEVYSPFLHSLDDDRVNVSRRDRSGAGRLQSDFFGQKLESSGSFQRSQRKQIGSLVPRATWSSSEVRSPLVGEASILKPSHALSAFFRQDSISQNYS